GKAWPCWGRARAWPWCGGARLGRAAAGQGWAVLRRGKAWPCCGGARLGRAAAGQGLAVLRRAKLGRAGDENGLRNDGAALWRAPRLLRPFFPRPPEAPAGRPNPPYGSSPGPRAGPKARPGAGRSDERPALLSRFLEVAEESAGDGDQDPEDGHGPHQDVSGQQPGHDVLLSRDDEVGAVLACGDGGVSSRRGRRLPRTPLRSPR